MSIDMFFCMSHRSQEFFMHMQTSQAKHTRTSFTGAGLLLFLIVLLAACGGSGNAPAPTPTSSAASSTTGPGTTPTPGNGTVISGTTGGDLLPTAVPGVVLGPQPCPNAVKDQAHWDAIIPTQSGTSHVEGVTCGNLLGDATLQALITVRYDGTGATLDVYVYNNITSPSPTKLFLLPELYK